MEENGHLARSNRALWLFVIAALTMSAVMQIVGGPLQTAAAPAGIVSFEFAGTLENAQRMLASWDQEQQVRAGLSLGLDYLFLVLYSMAIALACFRVAGGWRTSRPLPAAAGFWLGRGQWLAAGLDALENVALIYLLLGSHNGLWAPLAWGCAAVKFAIVAAGLLYVLLGTGAHLGKKLKSRTRPLRRGRRAE